MTYYFWLQSIDRYNACVIKYFDQLLAVLKSYFLLNKGTRTPTYTALYICNSIYIFVKSSIDTLSTTASMCNS